MTGIYLTELNEDSLRNIIASELQKALAVKPLPRKLTREQVAEMAHITLPTLHNWVKLGKLHPAKVEGRVLFDEDEVLCLLKRR